MRCACLASSPLSMNFAPSDKRLVFDFIQKWMIQAKVEATHFIMHTDPLEPQQYIVSPMQEHVLSTLAHQKVEDSSPRCLSVTRPRLI
mmetsp:Transcript_22896/g.77924  ORF Transcript_22896/g.77924 Transcript_22896/m.77924 type:complete len:88 (+) Transcript_22896:1684-1947(+)